MSLLYRYLYTLLCLVTRVICILLFDKYFQCAFQNLACHQIVISGRKNFWDFSILFPSRNRFTLISVFVHNIINWNLPGFAFNEFTISHFRIYPKLNLRLCNISPNIFPQELCALSSAKWDMSDFETRKNMSFMKILNNKGTRIDPCGIPQIISQQSLKLVIIFVLYFRLLRQSFSKCELVLSRPYASNLVISKSSRIQS